MSALDCLNLAMRWAHMLGAAVAAGGAFYIRFALLPAQEAALGAADRQALSEALRRRWSKLVAIAIAALLLSGLYNIWFIEATTSAPKVYAWYRPLFLVKFLLALGVFTISSLLSGRTAAAEAMRRRAKTWLNVNVALIVTIVLLSGVLRTAEKSPKAPSAAPQSTATLPGAIPPGATETEEFQSTGTASSGIAPTGDAPFGNGAAGAANPTENAPALPGGSP